MQRKLSNDVYESGVLVIGAKVLEQYKQDWKRKGFPDVELSTTTHKTHETMNDPSYQPTVEQELWVAAIREAIADYQKTSVWWNKPCTTCHDGQACSTEQLRNAKGNDFMGRKICPHPHSYHDCAHKWFATTYFQEICVGLGIDVGWFYKQIGFETRKGFDLSPVAGSEGRQGRSRGSVLRVTSTDQHGGASRPSEPSTGLRLNPLVSERKVST